MTYRNDYVTMSLDLNMFFLRIMMEHSFFIEIAFHPKDMRMAAEAKRFRSEFERLLSEAVNMSNGNVSSGAVTSKQFVTQFTEDAEKKTNFYTGFPFNTNLTRRESMLMPGNSRSTDLELRTDSLNRRALKQTASLVDFKNRLYQNVSSCNMFTMNYPSVIKHMTEEANHYIEMLEKLINTKMVEQQNIMLRHEVFWNERMMEHSNTMAGMLDPTEEALIKMARMFGEEFKELTDESKRALMNPTDIAALTASSIDATERLRNYKTSATAGLINCKIKSIILPLFADHLLREANHYLCELGKCD